MRRPTPAVSGVGRFFAFWHQLMQRHGLAWNGVWFAPFFASSAQERLSLI